MTIAARQTKTNELLGFLEDIINTGTQPDAFTLARLNRDADALRSINAAAGSIAKAGVAAIEWNIPEVIRWTENALRFNRDVLTLQNASTNLLAVNETEGVAELVSQYLELAPKDAQVVNRAIADLLNAGYFSLAGAVYDQAVIDGLETDETRAELLGFRRDFQHLGISIERVEIEMRAALKVLQINKLRSSDIKHLKFSDPEGETSFVVSLSFFGSFDDELRLESQLADVLGQDEEWNPVLLSTEFVHTSANDHQYQ